MMHSLHLALLLIKELLLLDVEALVLHERLLILLVLHLEVLLVRHRLHVVIVRVVLGS